MTTKVRSIKRKENSSHNPSQPKSVDPFIDPKTAAAFLPLDGHGHVHRLGLGGVVTGGHFLLMNLSFIVNIYYVLLFTKNIICSFVFGRQQ